MEDQITRKDLAESEERITAQITAQIHGLRSYIDERTHDSETRLLKAFHGWAADSEQWKSACGAPTSELA